MKAKSIFLITFLLIFISCKQDKNKFITYTSKVPFSPEFYRSIEFKILNDSAFLIQTLHLNMGFGSDETVYYTISSGKIHKIDNYFYAVDDLSDETILFSKDGDFLHLYGSRYDNLNFKMNKDEVYESDFDINEDNFRKKNYLLELAEKLNSYKEKIKVIDSARNKEIVLVNDSVVEFSNDFGLSLLLYNDSTYEFTIDNLLFSIGEWKFEKGCIVFDEFVTFTERNYPHGISEKLQTFIEKNENIYTSFLVDDSTLFMGTLPFAQSCLKMTKMQPGIRYKFFNSLRPPSPE